MKNIIKASLLALLLLSCQSTKIDSTMVPNFTDIKHLSNGFKQLPMDNDYPMLPPDMNYKFFQNASSFPFEPTNKDFSLSNCWWLSEIAFITYNHPGFAQMALELAGFPNFKYFANKGTECMVTWNDSVIIISFRGTELDSPSTIYDLNLDLSIQSEQFEYGGSVHSGFLKGLNNIWYGNNGLKDFIDNLVKERPDTPIWITGHSLGGGIASICFTRLKQATGLYIFGSPHVGNKEFISLSHDRPAWRIENNKDPVPKVPFSQPLLNVEFLSVGELVFLKENGDLIYPVLTPSIQDDQLNTFKDGITILDHAPISYSIKIWNALLKSKLSTQD